jgi:hypothetical protein
VIVNFIINVHENTIGSDSTNYKLSNRFISYSKQIIEDNMYLDKSISVEFFPFGESEPIITEKELNSFSNEKLKFELSFINDRIEIIAY